MASLREMQGAFAAALRDPSAACPVLPAGNLSIYRNNTAISFRSALESSFPVVRRRVGDDYFRQLSAQYRARFPSRSGDLHWIGRDFSAFLLEHLHGSEYAWLADLARLEWSRAAGFDRQGRTHRWRPRYSGASRPPSSSTSFSRCSLRCRWSPRTSRSSRSGRPIRSRMLRQWINHCLESAVWSAHAIDQLEVRPLEPRLFSYLSALAAGAPLARCHRQRRPRSGRVRERPRLRLHRGSGVRR